MDTDRTENEAAYRRGWTQSGEETTRLILRLIQLGHTPIEAQRLYAARPGTMYSCPGAMTVT